jgi:hypothetical protein
MDASHLTEHHLFSSQHRIALTAALAASALQRELGGGNGGGIRDSGDFAPSTGMVQASPQVTYKQIEAILTPPGVSVVRELSLAAKVRDLGLVS